MKNDPNTKISISVRQSLLHRIDEHCKLTGATRSGFYRVASERLLRDEEQAKMRQDIDRQVHPRQGETGSDDDDCDRIVKND